MAEKIDSKPIDVQTLENINSYDDLPNVSELTEPQLYAIRSGDLSSDYFAPFEWDGESYGKLRSIIDGNDPAIPDDDLSQYTETDPNNRISNLDSDSFEVSNYGRGDSGILSQSFDDMPNELVWSIDVEITNYVSGAEAQFGFSDESDVGTDELDTAVAGWLIESGGGEDTPDIRITDTDGRSEIYEIGLDNVVTVKTTYQFGDDSFEVEIIDGGTTEATESGTLESDVDYNAHYAFGGYTGDFGSSGNLDGNFSEHGFSAP